MEEDIRTAFDADRLNEKKFTIQDDEEMTKAIPIIKDEELAKASHDKEADMTFPQETQTKKKQREKMAVDTAHHMPGFYHGRSSSRHCFSFSFYA